MREIKLRAWDKIDEKIREVTLIDFEYKKVKLLNDYTGESYLRDFEEVILLEYTGLKDKNDKEIYEGDIVKYTFDLPESQYVTKNGLKIRIAEVFWCNWRSSFAVYANGNSKLANSDLFRYVRNGNRVEVIGNIYDNPELLKGDK
ncbi:hypothetical protein FDE94_09035 [Clostridium botulinum]|nr:hypothetical protein [Clostridium botulinum]